MAVPKGIYGFIKRLKKAEKALINYRKRHERLIRDCKKYPENGPIDYLPGLMWVQDDLVKSMKNIGFGKIVKCKSK